MAFQVGRLQHSPLGEYLNKGIQRGLDTRDRRKDAFLGRQHEINMEEARQGFQVDLAKQNIAADISKFKETNRFNHLNRQAEFDFQSGLEGNRQKYQLGLLDRGNQQAISLEGKRYENEKGLIGARAETARNDPLYEQQLSNARSVADQVAQNDEGKRVLNSLLETAVRENMSPEQSIALYSGLSDVNKAQLSFNMFQQALGAMSNFYGNINMKGSLYDGKEKSSLTDSEQADFDFTQTMDAFNLE